jgi:hypothetical protein
MLLNADVNHQPSNTGPWKLLLPLSMLAALVVLLVLALRPAAPSHVPTLPELARTNLWRQNDCWCLKGETNRFTGILLDYYPDGTLESRSAVSNGLLQGLSEGWYTNRQLQVREYYRTNVSDGPRTKWYPDGHKQSEATVVLGKVQGTFRRWYENGRLAEEIPMRDGKIEGLGRTYYESGFLKSEVTIHDGKAVQANSWPDGERAGSGQ